MKIAYFSRTLLSDVDISYLHSAQKQMDITYYLEITPRYLKGAAISLDKTYPKSGIFSADIYPELSRFAQFIDLGKVRIVNTSGRFWVLKSLITNIKLFLELKKEKYDVLHLSWPLNLYELLLYSLKKKTVLTVHDPQPHKGSLYLMSRIRRKLAFRILNNFIVLNHSQIEPFIKSYSMQKKNIYESRLSLYSYLKYIASPESIDCSNYILFFGRIATYKGLEYLFPAFEELQKNNPNVNLIVAGGGHHYVDISQYAGNPKIRIINRFIPDEELGALIRDSLFVVCPYTTATQSGVTMSAFAFNKPVIATNIGGLPEMLGDGKYGLLIKPRDVKDLTEAMDKLVNNPELLQTFANNIEGDYVTGKYSWDYISQEHEEIYKQVVEFE